MATAEHQVLRLDTKVSTSSREAERSQNQPPSTTPSDSTESDTPIASESAFENDSEGSHNESELRTCSVIRK